MKVKEYGLCKGIHKKRLAPTDEILSSMVCFLKGNKENLIILN